MTIIEFEGEIDKNFDLRKIGKWKGTSYLKNVSVSQYTSCLIHGLSYIVLWSDEGHELIQKYRNSEDMPDFETRKILCQLYDKDLSFIKKIHEIIGVWIEKEEMK